MVERVTVWALFLALLSVSSAASAQDAAPVRLAILPGEGERAPNEEVIAQLEVALTEEEDVTLLERSEVRRILREQNLSASGLTDPATAIRVGTLLSVELFLFVEKIPNTDPAACRIQIIETKTGIALASTLDDAQNIAKAPAEVMKTVRLALAKQRVPMENRHYIGILGVRNEEPGQMLDGLAKAFEMFLAVDLAQSPDIIVLDRHHLRWLSEEEALTETALNLKKSSVLVDIGIRRLPEQDQLSATILLRSMRGAARDALRPKLPTTDVPQARKTLYAVIAQAIEAEKPEEKLGDPEAEAAEFLRHTQYGRIQGDYDSIIRASEAAYALWPSEETRLAVAKGWSELSYMLSREIWRDGKDLGTASQAEKLRAMRAKVRSLEIASEYAETKIQRLENEGEVEEVVRTGAFHTLGVIWAPDNGETLRLQQEAAKLERQTFDLLNRYYRKHYEEKPWLYWDHWQHGFIMLGMSYLGQSEAKAEGLKECLTALASPPADLPEWDRLWMFLMLKVGSKLQRCAWQEDWKREAPPYVRVLSSFAKHKNPFARLTAASALVQMGENPEFYSGIILDTISKDIPTTHPMRRNNGDETFSIMAQNAAKALPNDAQRAEACRRLLEPWLEEGGEGWRVQTWARILDLWLDSLEKSKEFREADEAAERAVAALTPWAPKWRTGETKGLIRRLEERRYKYAKALGKTPAQDPAWDAFTFKPVIFKEGPNIGDPYHHFNKITVEDNHVLWVEGGTGSKEGEFLVALKCCELPQGGNPVFSHKLSVPLLPQKYGSAQTVADIALGRKNIFVATCSGLVKFPRGGGDAEVLTESDGLPGSCLQSVAYYDGRVYFGIRAPTSGMYAKCGFGWYDPENGASGLLASNTAKEKRSPLDKIGSYEIPVILPDTERKCLWILAASTIWRYEPSKDKWDCAVQQEWGINKLTWAGKNLLFLTTKGLFVFAPDRGETKWVCGGSARLDPKRVGCDQPPVFGYPGLRAWSCVYDGETLLTGSRGLYLHRKGHEPLRHPEITGYNITLCDTRLGVLALAGDKAWLINKKK